MSEVLNRFEVFSKIDEEIKRKIKIFHVFDDIKGQNVFFITSDDKVFGFGYNTYGCCGLGHNSVVNEPQIIPELCHKNIQQFLIGWNFILGLGIDKNVYGWGCNDFGQLGRGYIESLLQDIYFKPEIIQFSNKSERVIQLSCGNRHCLALTEQGKLFGWGCNEYGQIGCGEGKGATITSPLHLDIFPQFSVKTIHCFCDNSFVVTTDGLVYSWGSNKRYSLGHKVKKRECVFEPKKILNIPKVISVCPNDHLNRYLIYFLTNENQLYFYGFKDVARNKCDSFQKLLKLLNSELKFNSLFRFKTSFYSRKCLAVCDEKVFELGWNKITETKYNSLFDYCSEKLQISYKTIHIISDQTFDGNDLIDLQNYDIFDKYFINPTELGSGGFGTVLKVKDKLLQQHFAVKRIPFKGQKGYEEQSIIRADTITKS